MVNNENVSFIEKCMRRGFASMTKREYDVALFDALISGEFDNNSNGIVFKGKSDSELSRLLGMTLQKIRNLKNESILRYHSFNDEHSLQEQCRKTLQETKYRIVTLKVFFVVENPIVRSYLYETLRNNGSYFDTSFNQDIVSVDIKDLIYLWDKFLEDDEKNEFCKMVPKGLQEPTFIEKLMEAIKKGSVGSTFTLPNIITLCTAGVSVAKAIIEEKVSHKESNFD